MDIDPALQKLLLDTFRTELDEQLQSLTNDLLELEKKRLAAASRQQILESAFRSAHNIKGAAKGVDVRDIVQISHHLESLLSGLKQVGEKPTQARIDLSLEAIDRMRDSMQAFIQSKAVDFDLTDLCQRLEQATAMGSETPAEELSSRKSTTKKTTTKKTIKKTSPAETVTNEVEAIAESADTDYPAQDKKTDSIRVAAEKLDQVGALAEELQITKIEIDDHYAAVRRLRDSSNELARMWLRTMRQVKDGELDTLQTNIRELFTVSADTIGEMNESINSAYGQMRNTANNLGFVSTSLQSDIRTLRMVPASTVVRPLARTVRNIAQELGKEVLFEIEGDDLEIDRVVLQGVNDPLVHLLRNAIDHGIESTEERLASGKSREGHIKLAIRNDGSNAVIDITDDGGGIDVENIAKVAIKRGLLTESGRKELDDQELLDYILRPGFSTRGIITDLSGRGVGLDVVQTNLRMLKGALSISTDVGKGTTFTLRLPFTLSAEHGLILRVAGKRFAIPITSLERVIEIQPEDVVDVEASKAIILNGQPIPLRDLGSVLGEGQSESMSGDGIPVIVVSRGRQSVALVVDEIEGEREIVIKPLRPPIMSLPDVAGATVTGTGEVIMVLDAGNLINTALNYSGKLRSLSDDQEAKSATQRKILVVDDSITTRTLERNILETRGFDVKVATDGKEGWEMMEAEDFDLVITDIEMPVMNGFELAQRIKQSEKFCDIPVIIVTSLATEADKQRGIEVGADAYIVKSQFETMALLDIVRQLI